MRRGVKKMLDIVWQYNTENQTFLKTFSGGNQALIMFRCIRSVLYMSCYNSQEAFRYFFMFFLPKRFFPKVSYSVQLFAKRMAFTTKLKKY